MKTRSTAFCLLICAEAEYAYAKNRYMNEGKNYASYVCAKADVERAGEAYLGACRPQEDGQAHDDKEKS